MIFRDIAWKPEMWVLCLIKGEFYWENERKMTGFSLDFPCSYLGSDFSLDLSNSNK